jgi:hypothetical protein
MDNIPQLETTIQVLERSNEALATSNRVLITYNIFLYDNIRQITK